jgi:FIMAH domain
LLLLNFALLPALGLVPVVHASTPEPAYCTTLAGSWDGTTSTCTFSGSYSLSGTLEVTLGTTLVIDNSGSHSSGINNTGTITNSGTILIENSGFLSNGINNVLTISYTGTITNPTLGPITTGTINNSGTIMIENSGESSNGISYTATLSNTGTISNTVAITNSGTILLENSGDGSNGINNVLTITNSGTITVANTGGTGITNQGTINNHGTITINSIGSGIINSLTGNGFGGFMNHGFNNYGIITVGPFAAVGILNVGSSITNPGQIVVENSGNGSMGILNSPSLFGTNVITNSGTIMIENSGNYSYGINSIGGTISNSGTVTVENSGNSSFGITSYDTITNSGSILIKNFGTYSVGVANVGGTVTNSGIITVENLAYVGLVANPVPTDVGCGTIVVTGTGTTAPSPLNPVQQGGCIVLTPSEGPVDTQVSVAGRGFSADTAIGAFTYGGATPTTQTCTSQTTSATGTFACTFTVPPSTGANTVTASGSDVGTAPLDTASANFTSPTTLTISPTQGPTGSIVGLAGGGYSPSHTYNMCYEADTASPSPCSSTFQFTTDASGNIPSGLASSVVASGTGSGFVVVSNPDTGDLVSWAAFTITTPSITLSPETGVSGTSVTVTGSGFSVDMPIAAFTFGGATPSGQDCTLQTTSDTGAFSCTFTAPPSSSGANAVKVSGYDALQFYFQVPADAASATFTLLPTLEVSPSATVNPVDVGQTTIVSAGATGGSGSYTLYQWSGLPPGCSAGATSICTPASNSEGVYVIHVTVTDSIGDTATGTFTLTVDPALSLGALTSSSGQVIDAGQATTLSSSGASGGSGPGTYTYAWTNLPAGCSSSDSATIDCTPTTDAGSPFTVTLTVTDGNGNTAAQTLSLTVDPALSASPSATVNPVKVGQTTTISAGASGGSGTYTSYAWSGLPSGCASPGNAASFSCTPAASGSSTVTVTVTDTNGATATSSFTLTVDGRVTSLAIACPATAAGLPTTCTVIVNDTDSGTQVTPTGTVDTFSDGGAGGAFGSLSCTLSRGSCTVSYTPPDNAAGTTITISASYEGDSAHQPSTGSAQLSVLTQGEATQQLIGTVDGMNLQPGTANSLDSKLNSALISINNGNDNAAINQLNAFINEVNAQTGKAISATQAATLVSDAQAIIASLS